MKIFDKNLEILQNKFPLIYMHLLTKKERSKSSFFKGISSESKSFNFLKNSLNNFDTLYIYKCKNNPFLIELKKWLKKKNKKLIFIKKNL